MAYAGWVVAFLGMLGIIVLLLMRPKPTTPSQGMVIVPTVIWDSIQALANRPDSIDIRDTTIYRDNVVYRTKPTPHPVEKDTLDDVLPLVVYSDSLINDSTWVVINDIMVGELIDRQVEARPIYRERVKTVLRYVPKLVEAPVEVKRTQVLGSIVVGGDAVSFQFGPSIDIVNKKGMVYGVQYLTNTDWKGAIFVKVGVKF